ncbi:MAG: C45 family autoproteolytic acyltransferase/hydrolase, partial [Candidatus Hydrogenedentales bacterium]
MNRFRPLCALSILLILGLPVFAEGYRAVLKDSGRDLPLCVVKGTPYEMGKAFGQLFPQESQGLVQRIIGASQAAGGDEYSNEALDAAWAATSPYVSDHIKEEMRGLADGAGIPLETLIRAHMIPLISTYSCSSLALWDKATASGNLFLTRNLDWEMGLRAHDYPVLVLYLPDNGVAHVNVTFAGYIGCNTGMNAAGIALAEMGDSPDSDKPYDVSGSHFTMFFRDMLYDGKSMD